MFTNRSRFRPLLPPSLAAELPALVPQLDPQADPTPGPPADAADAEPCLAPPPRPLRRRLPWSELLLRTFDVNALKCPKCSASMVVLAFLTVSRVVGRILSHLGLPTSPPPIAPARDPYGDLAPEPEPFTDDGALDAPHPTCAPPAGRGPPTTE